MKTHRIGLLVVAGLVAAAIAAPLSQAALNNRVQLAGTFVAPAHVSEAQLNAGHAPSTRLVQIGGAQVAPSQLSAWESGAGGTTASGTSDESSGIGTGGIAAIAVLGSLVALAAASAMIVRHRRRLVTA
jgi:hypothetical protein